MTADEYTFREADQADFSNIAGFFRNNNYRLNLEQHLEKKYIDNPAGLGRIFVMEDSNKEIKGTLGYIPHLLLNAKTSPLLVMQSVDLFFSPDARGKKMFPKIQRLAMSSIGHPLIAFPNKRSEKITIDLGWKTYAPIERWYFPIRLNRLSVRKRKSFIFRLLRILSEMYTSLWLMQVDDEIELVPVEKFEHCFNDLSYGQWVGRSKDFLNWRFVDNPVRQYLLFELHLHADVIGYFVIAEEETTAVIYDFFATCRQRSCLRNIIYYCSTKGFTRLIFRGVAFSLWRFGFIKWCSDTNLICYKLPHRSWKFTLADSDW